VVLGVGARPRPRVSPRVTRTMITHSETETAAIGRELAQTLAAGSVVLLFGDLGAGKTAFIRGLAEGLGVNPDEVNSPTFTLIQEYRGGRLELAHIDLYRLNDPREIEELGIEDLEDAGVVAIEWAEKLARTPADAIRVRIEDRGGEQRQITIESGIEDHHRGTETQRRTRD
jgi:tRNA threonylcarbamoyladenosine biosynthesis protein TsaE